MDPHAPKLDERALKANKDKHERAIRALEKRVKKNQDGTLVLDVKDASELGVDPDAFKNLQQSLEETNKKIKSGEIRPDQISTSYDELPR